MSLNYTLDHDRWIEKRIQQGDEAEARLDAVAGQALRKSLGICEAVKRLRAVQAEIAEGLLPRESLSELLGQIALDLEQTNKVRANDPTPEEILRASEKILQRAAAAMEALD